MPNHLPYVHAEARAYDGGLPRIMTINIVYYYSLVCTRMSKNDGPFIAGRNLITARYRTNRRASGWRITDSNR